MIAAHTVCEAAQSKCTWTFHKSHFVYRKNVADQPEHPDQELAFRLTVRTLQSKHTVWGRKHFACIFTGLHALAALLAGCCNFARHGASYRRIIAMPAKEPNISYPSLRVKNKQNKVSKKAQTLSGALLTNSEYLVFPTFFHILHSGSGSDSASSRQEQQAAAGSRQQDSILILFYGSNSKSNSNSNGNNNNNKDNKDNKDKQRQTTTTNKHNNNNNDPLPGDPTRSPSHRSRTSIH